MANLFRADFHGWRAVDGLSKITVRQKFSNHTIFFLDYAVTDNQRYLMPPENTPFRARFGAAPLGVRPAYGYVNHIEDRVNEQGQRFTRVVGVGTSKVMNTANPSAWDGQSRSGIIRNLAIRHRFRTVMHSHPEALDTWATGTLSDFRAAVQLADDIGYRLWIDGATAWLLDPHLVLASASLASTKVINSSQQRDARVFKGSNVPGQLNASKRIVQYGIDHSTNSILTSTSGDLGLPVEVVTSPVTNYSAAQYTASGLQKSMQDQAVVQATFDGDATITPGSPVRFDTSASSTEQIGLWLVNEATHEVSKDGFTTAISASRDKSRSALSRIPDVVRREGATAPAVVRNGLTWEAEVMEHINV